MRLPKWVLFDYGHTLVSEVGYDALKGQEAVMRRVVKNPMGLSAAEIHEISEGIFRGICGEARKIDFETYNLQFQRLLYERLGIEFSVSPLEIEWAFWHHSSPGEVMPGVERVLARLHGRGIRTGVISNISFAGVTLERRIDALLPDHHFEFIMASSEYMVRKPSPMLFEVALRKCGVPAGDVWYCGDSVKHDVEGALACGIFPVWYDDDTRHNPFKDTSGAAPSGACLHVRTWDEFLEELDKLEAG